MLKRAGKTSLKIQEVNCRRPKDMEEVFGEYLENGCISMAIVCKKLKSNFPLDVFDNKKEKAILHSLTYKFKTSGRNETKSDVSNQNETENRNEAMSHKVSLKNYLERVNGISEECLVPYAKSKKSVFKQQHYISDIEKLKPIKEKCSLDKVIVKIRTEGKRQMVNYQNDNNGRISPFIISQKTKFEVLKSYKVKNLPCYFLIF